VADENESDVKCTSKDGAQQSLLTENQYDVGPQSEPTCSSTEPHLIPQVDRSNLVCHPNLSEDTRKSKPSASRLKYLNPPESDTKQK
jgi:hypothetical protein